MLDAERYTHELALLPGLQRSDSERRLRPVGPGLEEGYFFPFMDFQIKIFNGMNTGIRINKIHLLKSYVTGKWLC